MVEGLLGKRVCARASVCVCVGKPGRAPWPCYRFGVCVCTESRKRRTRPDSGREGRKFLCWSAATRRGCSEARGLEVKGFPGKICLRRHHQAHRKCRASACVCVKVPFPGNNRERPQGLRRLVKTPTPQKKIESTFVVFQQQSNLNLSKPWITSGSCNDACKTAPEADIDFQQNSRTQPEVAKEPRGGQR